MFAHSDSPAPRILAVADQTSRRRLVQRRRRTRAACSGDAVVDSIGQVGFDPGTEWGSGLTSTADNTLRRAAGVCVGDTDPSNAFDPAAEWIGFAERHVRRPRIAHLRRDRAAGPGDQRVLGLDAGTDVEYVELLAEPGTDVSGYRVLEIEGDCAARPSALVDEVVSFDALDDEGRALAWLPANALENGTISLLLVTGFTGALGDDLDANDDGVHRRRRRPRPSSTRSPSTTAERATAPTAAPCSTSRTMAGTFAPGAASRIPDGIDTDSTADWVRNDFDKAGIPGNTGTLAAGEAANTPGVRNSLTVVLVPLPPANCEAPVVTIGSVQGPGATSPSVGALVEIEGVVTGDFQVGGFDGYYVQDAGDGECRDVRRHLRLRPDRPRRRPRRRGAPRRHGQRVLRHDGAHRDGRRRLRRRGASRRDRRSPSRWPRPTSTSRSRACA